MFELRIDLLMLTNPIDFRSPALNFPCMNHRLLKKTTTSFIHQYRNLTLFLTFVIAALGVNSLFSPPLQTNPRTLLLLLLNLILYSKMKFFSGLLVMAFAVVERCSAGPSSRFQRVSGPRATRKSQNHNQNLSQNQAHARPTQQRT